MKKLTDGINMVEMINEIAFSKINSYLDKDYKS